MLVEGMIFLFTMVTNDKLTSVLKKLGKEKFLSLWISPFESDIRNDFPITLEKKYATTLTYPDGRPGLSLVDDSRNILVFTFFVVLPRDYDAKVMGNIMLYLWDEKRKRWYFPNDDNPHKHTDSLLFTKMTDSDKIKLSAKMRATIKRISTMKIPNIIHFLSNRENI